MNCGTRKKQQAITENLFMQAHYYDKNI
jgi:hypothetical protein